MYIGPSNKYTQINVDERYYRELYETQHASTWHKATTHMYDDIFWPLLILVERTVLGDCLVHWKNEYKIYFWFKIQMQRTLSCN